MIKEEFIDNLEQYAFEYIEECEKHTTQKATPSGKVVDVKDRHIPTVNYFLMFWLVKNKGESFHRSTWYEWLSLEQSDEFDDEKNLLIKKKSDTIKKINKLFESFAVDVVANEGKGIFYAKNKLKMSDKIDKNIKHQVEPITGMTIVNEPDEDETEE